MRRHAFFIAVIEIPRMDAASLRGRSKSFWSFFLLRETGSFENLAFCPARLRVKISETSSELLESILPPLTPPSSSELLSPGADPDEGEGEDP